MEENTVLCAASSYEQKYYLNPDFESLSEEIRRELQIMCVLYTEDVGGILLLTFGGDGTLSLEVRHDENDFLFDEIGSELKIRQLRKEKAELFRSLELFYKLFVLQ